MINAIATRFIICDPTCIVPNIIHIKAISSSHYIYDTVLYLCWPIQEARTTKIVLTQQYKFHSKFPSNRIYDAGRKVMIKNSRQGRMNLAGAGQWSEQITILLGPGNQDISWPRQYFYQRISFSCGPVGI